MEKNNLEVVKKKLTATKNELEAELKKLDQPVDFGDDVESTFDEEADEAEEFSTNMGMVDSLKRRYAAVVDAINKIDRGVYGTCEDCKKPIEAEVLAVDPESRYCIADKKKHI